MIIDTSAWLSALFSDQRRHADCAAVLSASLRRVVSPFVLAETDYLVRRHAGVPAEVALLGEVASGAYELAGFGKSDVDAAVQIVERYAGLEIGLTDASLVVLAAAHGTRDIFTLDERHFRAMATVDGEPFRLLPADS